MADTAAMGQVSTSGFHFLQQNGRALADRRHEAALERLVQRAVYKAVRS
jgi:hypothetical protein